MFKEGNLASEQELKQFCTDHLTKYKVPHHFQIVDALPRNSVGKILKQMLRETA